MRRLPFVNFLLLLLTLTFQLTSFSQTFTLLKDINPDPTGLDDFSPINVNGTVFFTANDGVHGVELWKTDGTTGGTVMVKDINPGSEQGVTSALLNVNGILFFSANDGAHGAELWKSDGTEGGTVLVKDIKPGLGTSCTISSRSAINAYGVLFFAADNGVNGIELWKSDGTEVGTVLIKDINTGRYPQGSGIYSGRIRFSDPVNFTTINGLVLFSAADDANGFGQELWKTDGTEAGTAMVKDIFPGTASSAIRDCINVNGIFYFIAHVFNDYELWKTDATGAGTIKLKTMDPSYSYDIYGVGLNSELYFLDEDGLYKSDGTEIGTIKIKHASQTPELLTTVNGTLYFVGSSPTYGKELWKSDGTSNGTSMVKDINSGTDDSYFSGLAKAGNKLVFSVSDGFHGYELWVSDGTQSGTQVLQDLDPDNAREYQIIEAGNKAYAVIATTTYGKELWVASVSSPILLPLTFLEFKGTLLNDDGLLEWKTDNETKTASFIVERSTDGNNYKPVGYSDAANTSGIHTYKFKDIDVISLGSQLVYYRLKQVDMNGKSTYSRIVALSIGNKANFVMIYPNPVRTEINMTLTLSQRTRLQWQLVDYSGRIIKNGIYDLSVGSTSVSIDASNLGAGTYLMQLKSNGLNQVLKVLKQ
ncbi:MAG: ELWxxDGT repeat protein [Chitinophagaceae bacterium]